MPILVDGSKEKEKQVPNKKFHRSTFKRQPHAKGAVNNEKQAGGSDAVARRKRSGDEVMEMNVSVQQGKEAEGSNKKMKFVGLADQPCGNQ